MCHLFNLLGYFREQQNTLSIFVKDVVYQTDSVLVEVMERLIASVSERMVMDMVHVSAVSDATFSCENVKYIL